MTTLAQLKEDHFARAGLVVDYLSESYDFNYGINSYVTLMNSNYSLGTGVRRNETTSEFTVSRFQNYSIPQAIQPRFSN